MASRRVRRKNPSLLALLICEGVLQSPDKVVTLYRLIDTFNFGYDVISEEGRLVHPEKTLSSDDVPIGFVLQCTVLTKWGPGEGEFVEELRVVTPDGTESEGLKFNFTKPSGFHMQQVNHQIQMTIKDGGAYAFRVYLNGKLMGEHPFTVNINLPSVRESS